MDNEITVKELSEMPAESYMLIDMRDEYAFGFGHIDNAVNIPKKVLEENRAELPRDKKLVICCKSGQISCETTELLCAGGYEAYNLIGGYYEWLREKLENSQTAERIEGSIRKKFHKMVFSKFTKAINVYRLVEPEDKIAVCISGGKDSMLMAKLFQELKRHGKFPFELVFLVMDPGYSPENRSIIEKNAAALSVPITVFESNIFDSVYNIEKSPCYICARMRRGYLYAKAKELGCNKIALGHHFDDVIETILMGMLYGGQVQTMMPRLRSANFEGMELIRPLYLIREDDIKRWRDYNDLHFIQCACKFTDTCTSCTPASTGSKRQEIKKLIAELKKTNPQVENNIFRSVENVNLNTIIAYKDDVGVHHFLDNYQC
ncbi:MAG: rhodanese-like domain-containing protein [Lachnospiraceae bacterium]|nr:rhodanese-like domain-containing protein [Ruminococcus sp.]MCM1275788.1 rhodanese-like domain-containing protein [Lachnospiraceae bacterium]